MKRVKIGNKYGWYTVSEYDGNPLTDDSDDERRFKQAVARDIKDR